MKETIKLYYESAYLRDFEANVLEISNYDEKWQIALDATCFYPGGGGQPPDLGILGEVVVKDCYAKNGIIYHILENKPNFTIGDKIAGSVDFPRRFAFMQNHTGEHLLSGLAKSRYNATNVGFHMSERGFTIDFDLPLTKENLDELEACANELVNLGGAIDLRFVKGDILQGATARSKKDFGHEENVRLVEIPGWDLCACAGLHVADLAEVSIVKIAGCQRYKGGVRLNVFCGSDALWDYSRKNDIVQKTSSMLSAETDNITGAITRLKEVGISLKKEADSLKNRIFELQAATVPNESALVYFIEDSLESDDLRRFAAVVAERAKIAVALTKQGNVVKYAACGHDNTALADFAAALNAALDGKGGISGGVAQGALKADFAAVCTYLEGLS